MHDAYPSAGRRHGPLQMLTAALCLLGVVACGPSYRLYEVAEAGDIPTGASAADTSRPVAVSLAFGYPADDGGLATITNRSPRSLLLDVANSQIAMNGYTMRLVDGPEFAFDGLGPELRFAGAEVSPRDGVLYPRIGPGATLTFPVPALRLGGCAEPENAHCGRYAFAFVVEADGTRPEDRYRRAIEAYAVRGGKVGGLRPKPPPSDGTYLSRDEGSAMARLATSYALSFGVPLITVIVAAMGQ